MKKKCTKCGELKDFSEFSKNKSKKDGLSGECKECVNEYSKKYYHNNREKVKEKDRKYYQNNREKIREAKKGYQQKNQEKIKEYKKKYYQENREKHKEVCKKYYQENRKKHNETNKKYYQENREKINEYQKNRKKTDINFKLSVNLRTRLHSALKNNYKSGSAVKDLGCSIEELKAHLESQFEPGMSWDNWSSDGWHIDHIIPLSSFDLSDREELLKACHYTNLQPMWAKDNLKKGNKIKREFRKEFARKFKENLKNE